MIDRTTMYWTRWFCLPVVLFASLFFLLLILQMTLGVFHLWQQSLAGFVCAVLWVALAFLVAPDHKLLAAVVSFLVGALIAWFLIGPTDWPDYRGTTRLSTYITWAGGLLSLASLLFVNKTKKRTQPRPSCDIVTRAAHED